MGSWGCLLCVRRPSFVGCLTLVHSLFFLMLASPFAHEALAQVRGTIFGPGVRQYPIALAPLRDVSGGMSALGVEFVDIVERNLAVTGLFHTVPRESYIEGSDTAEINFDNWSVIGAIALVKGTLEHSGGDIVLEVRLYDVSQRRSLTGRRYRGGAADLRRMANRFSDEIMAAVTGERGPFDSKIAFVSNRGAGRKDIYVMSVAGGDLHRVTRDDTLNLAPSWSPDGKSLLLTSYTDRDPNLFALDLPSSRLRRLSDSPGLELGGVWSPDGQHLAVAQEDAGNSDIVILAPDGSLERRLTDHWAIDVSPSWSPDGRQIAFCSSRSGSPQIYVIDAAGGSPRRVTTTGNYNTSPRWSPRGDRLAYTSRLGGRFQVFTVAKDGSGVHQVTKSAGDSEGASWSPDGRYLVFSSTRAGTPRLYVSDTSGLSQVELTAVGGGDTSPAWSGWID